jgi:hypothetical protein
MTKYSSGRRKPAANQTYCTGIDETLALLKFGFTCASLWYFFDSEVPDNTMKHTDKSCLVWLIYLGETKGFKHGHNEGII